MNKLVFLFDVFGTVFDMSTINRSEIGDYVRHVKSASDWQPLILPESWSHLEAYNDAVDGILDIRAEGHYAVTMTNCPVRMLVDLSRRNDIQWDLIVPIEERKVYKPNSLAYLMACDLMRVEPSQCVMVTANPTFGDVEAAQSLGIWVDVIDRSVGGIDEMAKKYMR